MKIYNYRTPNVDYGDPWKDCLFTDNAQLDSFGAKPLVSFNNQPLIQQHHVTYVTGKETCHAHHFVKMLTSAVLNGDYSHAPSIAVTPTEERPTVLWIDTVHGPHTCASLFKEMTAQFNSDDHRFYLLCLDMLGSFRENFWELTRQVESYIKQIKPTLVVVDDVDHLMPYCGINIAAEFNKIVRDTTNHSETAFLFIGYNHLGKQASTTGNVGKMLFTTACSVFSVTTQHAVSRVRLVRANEIMCNILDHPDNEFLFSIADDNLLHELVDAKCPTVLSGRSAQPLPNGFLTQTILHDIFSEVIEPGKTISTDELTLKLTSRRQQLNRIEQSRTLIAQAAHLGVIHKSDDGDSGYTLAQFHPKPCKPTDNEKHLTIH